MAEALHYPHLSDRFTASAVRLASGQPPSDDGRCAPHACKNGEGPSRTVERTRAALDAGITVCDFSLSAVDRQYREGADDLADAAPIALLGLELKRHHVGKIS